MKSKSRGIPSLFRKQRAVINARHDHKRLGPDDHGGKAELIEGRQAPVVPREQPYVIGSQFVFLDARQRQRARWIKVAGFTVIPAILAMMWAFFLSRRSTGPRRIFPSGP